MDKPIKKHVFFARIVDYPDSSFIKGYANRESAFLTIHEACDFIKKSLKDHTHQYVGVEIYRFEINNAQKGKFFDENRRSTLHLFDSIDNDPDFYRYVILNIRGVEKEAVLEYHREPTSWEIKFGEGATHYKDFDLEFCLKPNGDIKKWVKCPYDGLRYYR